MVEDFTEPSVYSAYEGTTSQRLIVVANRLPVSAVRERDGSWSLQVRLISSTVSSFDGELCSHPFKPDIMQGNIMHDMRTSLLCLDRSAPVDW